MEQNNSNVNVFKVSKTFSSSQLEDIIPKSEKENESNEKNNIINIHSKERSNPYQLENDEILPYSPEMLEDLLKSDSKVSESKNNTSEKKQKNEKKIKDNEIVNNIPSYDNNKSNINNNNIKENNSKGDNILSFEELLIKKKQIENISNNDNKENKPKKINKIISSNKKDKGKEKSKEKVKENVINFEDLLVKRTEESLSKSKDKSKNKESSTSKKKKKNPIKIDFNGRLYQQKKNYQKLKEEEEKQGNEIIAVNNIKKYNTKSQKRPNKKMKIFNEIKEKNDNLQNEVGFEYFMRKKGKENLENKSKDNINKDRTKSSNKSRENKNKSKENNQENSVKKSNKNNAKIINDFLNRNVPKKKEKEEIKKDKSNSSQIKQIRKNKPINKVNNRKDNSENMVDFKIFKKDKSARAINFKNFKERLNNNNELNPKSKKKESANKKRKDNIRKIKRVDIDDRGVPLGVTEAEINLAMKNKEFGKNFQKRFSPIQDNLINFDNSKFAKYDTEQIRYGLIKDYYNIHPNKDDKFLQRMQFESLKRKNQAEKINELVEKSKHKIDEAELKETFNRLVDDANRRFIEKQGINDIDKEKEKDKDMSFKALENSNPKKYNEEEWNEIYYKRFKDYDEYKKKRMEIKREKEKIEKMIEEEEQLKLCRIKKIPVGKIRENSKRLYEEAKKREVIKKRKMTVPKSAKNYGLNKDNLFLNSFNDEEDASKYMKSYKSETYNFLGNNFNNKNNLNYDYNNYNNMNYNYQNNYKPKNILGNNQIYNGGDFPIFYKNNLNKKFNNMFITEANTRTANQSKNKKRIRKKLINYPFSENKNYINNHTFENKYKDFPGYNDFKANRLKKGVKIIRINPNENNVLQSPYGYYNYINNKLSNDYNKANQYNNGMNCRENVVDNYLYNYCINRYFNQNSLN